MTALDTSTLGRICHDHDAVSARAQVVRGALKLIAGEAVDSRTFQAAAQLATADDETLAKLGRLIR